MYKHLEELVNNKKVLILGFGREGKSTYNVIKNFNCSIGIADVNDVAFDAPVKFFTGCDYQKAIYEYDIVFKSPGIVLEDNSLGVISKIISQTDLMIQIYKERIVGITGTKGKSTVTTLVYHILKNTVGNSILMGNIGIPAFDMLEEIDENSILIYELSCHQLEYAQCSPHIGVLLNVFEEHLDHYGTFEKYQRAKQNIYAHQNSSDILICNINNCPSKPYDNNNLVKISLDINPKADVYLDEDEIIDNNSAYPFDIFESSLIGRHNMFNIAVAFNVCKRFGVSIEDFLKHLKTYKPLPHRLEFIGEKDGIKFYDDSISTISETTIRGLNSLENVGTLIVGGMDRGICYKQLIEFLQDYALDNIIFMYETGKIIYDKIVKEYYEFFTDKNLILVNDLEEAVVKAKNITQKRKVCLMSPAAASYGYFKNFEDRGDKFKEYVFK